MNQKNELFDYLVNQATLQEFEEILSINPGIVWEVDEAGDLLLERFSGQDDEILHEKFLITYRAMGFKIPEAPLEERVQKLIRHQTPECMAEALKNNPLLVTQQDKNGQTLLHHLAHYGHDIGSEDFKAKMTILV